LRERIAEGRYRIGDLLPSIDELNDEYFGESAGPKSARDAYASLIAQGMVEARVGRGGGHFLVSTEPMPTHQHLDDTAGDIATVLQYVSRLAQRPIYIVDIWKVRSDKLFGECLQPNREAAEQFATSLLCALGEPESAVARAVGDATQIATVTRPGGYHVRIYGRRLGEQLRELTGN
jgi:hypothetical protein